MEFRLSRLLISVIKSFFEERGGKIGNIAKKEKGVLFLSLITLVSIGLCVFFGRTISRGGKKNGECLYKSWNGAKRNVENRKIKYLKTRIYVKSNQ